MHVVSPERYRPKPKRRKIWPFFAVPAVVLLTLGGVNFARPLPTPVATVQLTTPAPSTPALIWPSYGQQALAAANYGQLATNGSQTPLATASITKVILALCVLEKQPLKLGETGPVYTMNSDDVDLYESYAAQNGSLIPIALGEQLTEYQMIEALMIPSANNIADSLVAKIFGSQDAYTAYANQYLLRIGLSQTKIGTDASGYDASTVSTASELAQLGLVALKNPVLMEIAGQKTATFPTAGTVRNYNTVLGVNGINGLKTGNNDANPGALLFTATSKVGAQTVQISGTVMGAPNLQTALDDSTRLVASAQQSFEPITLAKSGQTVGVITTAWGESSPIVTANSLELVRWKATPLTEKHTVDTGKRSGEVGSMQVAAGHAKTTSVLELDHTIAGPSFWWRLTRH